MNLTSHGIVALIQNDEGKFLLLEEARDLLHGAYAPPHGRCESIDATEEDAVVREAYEETGLQVRPIKKLLTQPADTKVKTVSFWLTQLAGGELTIDSHEVARYGWYTTDEALKLPLYPGTKIFFDAVKAGTILIDGQPTPFAK